MYVFVAELKMTVSHQPFSKKNWSFSNTYEAAWPFFRQYKIVIDAKWPQIFINGQTLAKVLGAICPCTFNSLFLAL